MKKFITLLTIIAFTINVNAQKNEPAKATNTGKITNVKSVQSIAEQLRNGTFIPADNTPQRGREKMKDANKTIIGKGLPKGNDPLIGHQQRSQKISAKAPSLVFTADISQATPSDPTGAVGPNHYIGSWNSAFRIFDKSGNPLTPEASLGTIFPGNAIGDPIILYDAAADRFIITEFDSSPNGFNVAISQGPNPVTDGWHVYTTGFGTGAFPDYTKFSIWSDGYYVTANIGASNRVFVVEREEMLQGNSAQFVALPLPGISTSGFYSPQVFNVGNSTLPANGNATVVYMQDDEWGGVSQDHLKLWSINVDWSNTANSTISAAQQINTAAFTGVFDGGSFSNLTQPSGGAAVDAMQATIMNQAQFRKFPTHNSAVFNFVVDADGGGELAAVRWYELRQVNDSAPWTIHQEGTYTAPNGKHAWAASMAMDNQGNIGMAYTSMGGSSNQRIAINYTGRFNNDPLNTMTVSEELISQSTANCPSTRYADYTHLTIDPTDDQTFWHIAEVFIPNRSDVVGVFKLEQLSNDTGVTNIDAPTDGSTSATEQVTITINNFGDSPQSNIPVSYTFNGNTENEVYTGTIAAASSAQYTFTATVDMSTGEVYNIEACTNLSGDENTSNNCSNVTLNQLTLCTPIANDGDTSTDNGCNLDGIKHFILGTIDIDDGANGCNNEGGSGIKGYADRRHLSTDLDVQVGTYTLQAQMNWDGGVPTAEQLSVWIDFNDNGTFEGSEQLISGATFTADNALVNFDLILPASSNLGSHVLRARCLDTTGSPGDVNDPCANYQFGETHDYTVNIVDSSIGVDDELFNETDFIVSTLNNNQFNISVNTTEITDRLTFTVTNLVGQKLLSYQLENTNGKYEYDLDMSYATPGVYIIRLGNTKLGNTKKIIIK